MKCRYPNCNADAGPYGLCPYHVSSVTMADKLKMRAEMVARISMLPATGAHTEAVLDARLLVDMERQP